MGWDVDWDDHLDRPEDDPANAPDDEPHYEEGDDDAQGTAGQ
jgi:hypothetical protein